MVCVFFVWVFRVSGLGFALDCFFCILVVFSGILNNMCFLGVFSGFVFLSGNYDNCEKTFNRMGSLAKHIRRYKPLNF